MPWKPNLTVAAIIESDGRFLLVQERDQQRLVLNQPAGHLEPGESLVAAAIRETREETGRHFEPEAIIGIYRYHSPTNDVTYLRVCFSGTASAPQPGLALDTDIVDNVWLSQEELLQRQLRSPLVARCVADYLAGVRYPLDLLIELDSPS